MEPQTLHHIMKFKTTSLLAAGFLCVSCINSQANSSAPSDAFTLGGFPVYMEWFGGMTTYPDLGYGATSYEMDNGFNIGASFGLSISEQVDVELELLYTKTSYTGYSDEFTSFSLMANVYYNMPITGKLVAYIGAGAGPLQVAYDATGSAYDQDWVLGYQLTAGLRYPISEKLELFTEYRYLDAAGHATLYSSTPVEYESQNITAGIRCKF